MEYKLFTSSSSSSGRELDGTVAIGDECAGILDHGDRAVHAGTLQEEQET